MNYQSIYQFMETGKAVSDHTEQDLTELINKYPWFESGQMLAALYKLTYAKEDAAQQLQKAQLYMSNPLWLNWQMMKFHTDFTRDTLSVPDNLSTKTEEATSIMKTSLIPEKKETIEKTDELLSFEPLYTIDYFASQGIKLQQEQLGNDNFSQQVKTFTQWLKTMKKIYQEVPSAAAPQKEDGEVVEMADASNRNEEIFTETMAEVLLSQGKKKQAMAIYEKLSLLYPEKSSYFTAKISALNT